MAIIFQSDSYNKIEVDSRIIIGITGYEYKKFLQGITGENVYNISNYLVNSNSKVSSVIDVDKIMDEYLKDLGLNESFLDKSINVLSHSELKLLKYLQMLIDNSNILVIDEPFLDLDYDAKKRIISLLKKMAKRKTIIIGSQDINVIYSLCKKVLLLGKKKYLYDDVVILANKRVLRQFHISMPEILEFIRLAKDKKINLPYSKDIRDLIKDVYRNVSK